jgi:pyridoxal phosphate enzyme (YggS family)
VLWWRKNWKQTRPADGPRVNVDPSLRSDDNCGRYQGCTTKALTTQRHKTRQRNKWLLGERVAADGVRENLTKIRARIAAAAHRAGRRIEEITLIGVSKTHSSEAIRAAYAAGLRDFGENRVQEWEGKRATLADLDAKWHLIGHLQSNKAARAAGLFHCVDSVDDFSLAQRLDRARGEAGGTSKLRVLLEVRVAEEETKSGVNVGEVAPLAEKIAGLPLLQLSGLMCIPPFREEAEQARPYFRLLRELRDRLAGQFGWTLPVLSMGMSHDFEVAIEEGATEVRVGTALFGRRPAPKT